jgi:hypothetical protein
MILELLNRFPTVHSIEVFEDRDDHFEQFLGFGSELVSSSRPRFKLLDEFFVHKVDANGVLHNKHGSALRSSIEQLAEAQPSKIAYQSVDPFLTQLDASDVDYVHDGNVE